MATSYKKLKARLDENLSMCMGGVLPGNENTFDSGAILVTDFTNPESVNKLRAFIGQFSGEYTTLETVFRSLWAYLHRIGIVIREPSVVEGEQILPILRYGGRTVKKSDGKIYHDDGFKGTSSYSIRVYITKTVKGYHLDVSLVEERPEEPETGTAVPEVAEQETQFSKIKKLLS